MASNVSTPIHRALMLLVLLVSIQQISSFMSPSPQSKCGTSRFINSRLMAEPMSKEDIKQELEAYLEKRREINADELAKAEKGKVIGGTKGNKVLEYIGGAPAKEFTVERIPNVFDYSELTKYGYSKLVTPIMDLGGRKAVYELMGMDAPAIPKAPRKPQPKDLVFDRTGEEDAARYKGLKMGLLADDDMMGEALAKANEKTKQGESMRPKLMEEEYELPYADKRNTGPRQTPDWTPEMIDEYTKLQGKSIDWVRRARLGAFVKDPEEQLVLNTSMTFYFLVSFIEVALAFGKSTPTLLRDYVGFPEENIASLLDILQGPGLALCLASVGSTIVCGVLAPPLNRNKFIWALKGFLAGPVAVNQLRGLETLVTRAELEEALKARD